MLVLDELINTIEENIKDDNPHSDYRSYMLGALIKKLTTLYEQTSTIKDSLHIDSLSLGEISLDFKNSTVKINPFQAGKRAYITPTTTHEITIYLKKGSI